MLRIPSFRQIGDVTVYQDDAVWYRFYQVPAQPTVRLDSQGHPVFLLTTYALSAQERAADPTLPRGGGYMNFDVQYAVTEQERQRARTELQAWVDDEFQRRKADPEFADSPEFLGTTAPTVELAEPLVSGGTVSMLTAQSERLVSGRFAEAPASVVSGSTAVFNVDLTEAGSAFMRELMVDESGSGAVDLTPIQVIYDLKMWARLPPIKITVEAESERMHETLLKVSETNRDNPCTRSEIETYRENGLSSSTLKESGDVVVHIDKGDATVPDDVVNSLQDYALELFDTMIEERFLVPASEDDQGLEFDSDDPGIQDRDAGWGAVVYSRSGFSGDSQELTEDTSSLGSLSGTIRSARVRSGHRLTLYSRSDYSGTSRQLTGSVRSIRGAWRSAKIWRPPTSRYKVRKTVNHSTMELKIEIDRSQVVEWPTGGQATLQTFFSGMSKQEIQRHVVHVNADFFDTLRVEVRGLVDYAASPIQAIEAQLQYKARDETGEEHAVNRSYTFTTSEPDMKLFDPAIINAQQEYEFRYKLIFDDGSQSDYTPWETTSNRALNISATDPRRLQIDVSAASLNWDVVSSVSVRLSHGEGAVEVQQSFELTKVAPSARFDKRIVDTAAEKVTAELTYVLADSKVVEADPRAIDATDTLFVVPQPQVDILNVSLLPAGDWSEVAQVVVQLEYERSDGRVYDKTYRLKSIDQFAEWTVLLDEPDRRKFRYQQLTAYSNGESETGDWIEAEGDQTLLIKVKGVPKINVTILGALIDFVATPAVVVNIQYANQPQSFTFTAPGSEIFSTPLEPGGDRHYVYDIVYHTADGEQITVGPERSTSTQLLVPKAHRVESGFLDVSIRGFAVDFAATPFVDVELVWTDGTREERTNLTLTQDQPIANWKVAIGDRAQRVYRYEVTYNRADGTRAAGASGQTDDPVISIVALQE